MAKPLVQELNILEKGVIMYDSFLQDDILVVAPVLCIICDNPRASEIINNLSLVHNTSHSYAARRGAT